MCIQGLVLILCMRLGVLILIEVLASSDIV